MHPGSSSPDTGVSRGAAAPAVDLGELLRATWPQLVAYAFRLLDDLAAAEDVVQRGFVRLWERGACRAIGRRHAAVSLPHGARPRRERVAPPRDAATLDRRGVLDNARLSATALSSWSATFMTGRDDCFPPSLYEVASNPNLRRGL